MLINAIESYAYKEFYSNLPPNFASVSCPFIRFSWNTYECWGQRQKNRNPSQVLSDLFLDLDPFFRDLGWLAFDSVITIMYPPSD